MHDHILSLPKDYLLYPAHDYKGKFIDNFFLQKLIFIFLGLMATSVAEELLYNPRLTRSKEEFIQIMQNLKLAPPKQIGTLILLSKIFTGYITSIFFFRQSRTSKLGVRNHGAARIQARIKRNMKLSRDNVETLYFSYHFIA